MTCPSGCQHSLQHQRKMSRIRKEALKANISIKGSTSRDVSLVFMVLFFCLVGEVWTRIINVTDLQFNSCTVTPHLNIPSTVEAGLIIHLSVGIVKVPDHLKPSRRSFSSPPLDSRWTERAEINKYITWREFKGAWMAFLLSPCQQRVNNGNIKICPRSRNTFIPFFTNQKN